MVNLRQAARLFIPPILALPFRNAGPGAAGMREDPWFRGNYSSWGPAAAAAGGYDAEVILQTQLQSARKVRDGEAQYERDSVVFDHVEYFFPALSALLYVASRNGNRLSVLDFGGALGSTYFQNRGMLSHLTGLTWTVVEQPHYVAAGRAEFETDQLKFRDTVEDCFAESPPDVVLLSSVLQYLEDPMGLLAELAERKPAFILVDRTPVLDKGAERIVVQTVPPSIYPASYACRLLARHAVEQALAGTYDRKYEFDAHVGTTILCGDRRARYRGWFFEHRGEGQP